MKKSSLGILLFVLSISLVSAQGLGELLDMINESTLILSAVFIISFSLIFFSLQKFFKGNATTSGAIAAMIALVITYSVNKSGVNIEGFFFDIGVSSELLMTIIPVIVLGGIIFTIVALRQNSLFVFGGLLIFLSFFTYEKTVLVVLGIILLIIGFVLPRKKKEDGFYISKK